jgi:hypothetical protein
MSQDRGPSGVFGLRAGSNRRLREYFTLRHFTSYTPRHIYIAHSGPRPLIQFRNNFSRMVGLLGRVTSPSQSRYLHTGQHKHRINAHTPKVHALSGIRTHDPGVQASEDSSYLRPRVYCDRPPDITVMIKSTII